MRVNEGKVDILIVDDRLDGLITLEAVLSEPRLNIVKASSGREALEALHYHDFAVILLDVQMPDMDGFETATNIRMQEKFRHIPILFVTAINKDERYVYRGYEAGAVDYIFKPFDPMILKSKVSVFIELYRQARKIHEQEAKLVESERSERVRQLAEMEVESLRRYRNLADAIPHVVCRAKPDGTHDYWNQVWTDYSGLSLEESIGTGWQQAFHAEDLPRVLKAYVDAMITGNSFETEARVRRKDGVWRWNLVRGVPEKNQDDELCAWLGTMTDIDDRKRVETEMKRAKDEAEGASRAKTQFLANMSHEIRTPLSAILGFSELLLNQNQPPEERHQAITTIRRNGEQLLHLINEILDISKVESGKLEVENVRVDCLQLLQEIRSLYHLKCSEKSLSFMIECGANIPSMISTDPVRLRQILTNLIGNSLKFTEKGSIRVQIEGVTNMLRPELTELVFRVVDTGIGISPEGAKRLFQPFMQADSSTTRRFGGTGLGLALSRKLARSLGGDVQLISSSPEGTEFEIRIACKGLGQTRLPIGHLTEAWRSHAPIEETTGTCLKGLKLLLVDDAPDNQVLISRFLKMAGASVDVASNGQEAVDRALQGAYDLILMDIQMPGMDGYTATSILRQEDMKCPIIALTAHALKTERIKCLAAGFDDHLSKPINRVHLITSVARWVEAKAKGLKPVDAVL